MYGVCRVFPYIGEIHLTLHTKVNQYTPIYTTNYTTIYTNNMNTTLLTYCNTRQFFTNKWKGEIFDNSFYLSDMDLQKWNITRCQLEAMPQIKTIGLNKYNVIGVNEIDISLIKPHGRKLTDLHKYMMKCIVAADLPTTVETTAYWNAFVKHRKTFAELFFISDAFSGRIHTPISGMSKELRPYLMIQGEQTVSYDISQMQPTLLANILYQNIGKNEFSDTINKGADIYTMLQENAALSTRNDAKKLFFQMLFGKPSNQLDKLFAKANFIEWINWYKGQIDPRNPHNKEKPYSNLSYILQNYEVRIMAEIWLKLALKNIPFLTVHDEIIARQSDTDTVKTTIESVLNKHFKCYKLNIDKLEKQVQEPTPINKKTLLEIGFDILGEVNNLTKNSLLAEMIRKYNITDTRAKAGFDLLLKNNIIEPTNVDTFYMTHSTPF